MSPTDEEHTPTEARAERERRRRRAEVFGDVLPDTTGDDRDPESPGRAPDSEAWLRANVPPHHG